nr:host cell division inhibitor Icd-like protein [Rosenbergiella collisarenosi]
MAIDSRSYSSGSNLSCTAKRSFLLSLVDIINHLSVSFPNVDNVYQRQQKQNPVSADTPTRFLTTTDRLSIEEAVKENTTPAQGRHSLNLKSGNEQQSFIWIIAAIRRDCPTIKATIHHIVAPTEREARLSLVKDHVCFFAGRINQAVSHV